MLAYLQEMNASDSLWKVTTNLGAFTLRLYPEIAPKTVENFTRLAEQGYYENTIFHRIIRGFMIQGGDPTGTGRGGESVFGQTFEDELSPDARHFAGALSMANRGPNTNGSQFFIVTAGEVPEDTLQQMRDAGEANGWPDEVVAAYEKEGGAFWLDGKHTVFGHVVDGMDVVRAMESVETGPMDKPVEDVRIESVKRVDASV